MSLATQTGLDAFATQYYSKFSVVGQVDYKGLRPSRWQLSYLVVKTITAKKIKGRVSGTSKFSFSLMFKKGQWRLDLDLLPGTSRQDAYDFLDAYDHILTNPIMPGPRQTPYGFSVFRLKAGKNIGPDSRRNYKSAVKSRFFDQRFSTLCQKNNLACRLRLSK